VTEATFETPAGVEIFWREFGNPDGIPTLWIHGGSVEDSSMMLRDLQPFAHTLRVLVPDARGHGRSSRFENPADYRWGAKCADMVALLDHLGIDRAVWGGNSMGAALSLWAGIHFADRVRAVIDISGPPAATAPDEQRWWAAHRYLIEGHRFAEYLDANLMRRSGAEAVAKLHARPERYGEIVALLERHTVASFLALLEETFSRPNWLADCAAIRCPTLVIGGSEDTFPDPAQTRAVAELIPGAQLHLVTGGPHFPNRTHRSEVQSVIGTFLQSTVF
jgi:pimeloyl-ACP methyl ester carboxylesterase